MHCKTKIGDRIFSVEVGPTNEAGEILLTLDGEPQAVMVREVGPHQLHIEIAGMAANLFISRTSEGSWIWVNGRTRFVQDADLIPRRKLRGLDNTPSEVTPPTPATVIRILVEVGSEVAKGQGCVVVSAMKMEMTLNAPYGGVVKSVNTTIGAQVSPGQILVEIEPDTEVDQNE